MIQLVQQYAQQSFFVLVVVAVAAASSSVSVMFIVYIPKSPLWLMILANSWPFIAMQTHCEMENRPNEILNYWKIDADQSSFIPNQPNKGNSERETISQIFWAIRNAIWPRNTTSKKREMEIAAKTQHRLRDWILCKPLNTAVCCYYYYFFAASARAHIQKAKCVNKNWAINWQDPPYIMYLR